MFSGITKKRKPVAAVPARDDYLANLGKSTLSALRKLHCNYSRNGATRDTMLSLFGEPRACLVCAKPINWDTRGGVPDDVDPWFCLGCCPICDSSLGLPSEFSSLTDD